MEINMDGVDERLLGANRPFERMLVLYVQIYERMIPLFNNELTLEEWDNILSSLDLMLKYISEIKDRDLTEEFKSMRVMYVDMITESIKEIEEAIEND